MIVILVACGKGYFGELGEVITGRKRARCRISDITVFDSTGLAAQDVEQF